MCAIGKSNAYAYQVYEVLHSVPRRRQAEKVAPSLTSKSENTTPEVRSIQNVPNTILIRCGEVTDDSARNHIHYPTTPPKWLSLSTVDTSCASTVIKSSSKLRDWSSHSGDTRYPLSSFVFLFSYDTSMLDA